MNDRNRNFRPEPEPEPKSFRFGSGSVILTETGIGILLHTVLQRSAQSIMSLTIRSKKVGISIILHKNLLYRVISSYCGENISNVNWKYIENLENIYNVVSVQTLFYSWVFSFMLMSVILLESLKKYQNFQKRPKINSFLCFFWLFLQQKHTSLCIFHILVL